MENNVTEKPSFVPTKNPAYVPFGHYNTVKKIIKSKKFYPVWITGLAGNGKTEMIRQVCADLGREFIRVNFTSETDEGDLLGSFRLVDGNTVYHEGPVSKALREGMILLLDEIDLGHTNRVLCLQSIMEGKGVLIKATGEYIQPAEGFNIFATSNTKGRGSDDGKFIGTSIMNGAFMDRFAAMIPQAYPPKDVEESILKHYFIDYCWGDKDMSSITREEQEKAALFIAKLTKLAHDTRKAYEADATEEVLSTRTLINIIQGYAILDDGYKAIEMACERFSDADKGAFMDMFRKMNDDNFLFSSKEAEDEDDQTIEEI